MKIEPENTKKIYEALSDDESRIIFESRMNFSLTGNHGCLKPIIHFAEEKVKDDKRWQAFEERLKREKNGIYIYGCGMYGKELLRLAEGVKWRAYIDRQDGGEFEGLKIISPDTFQEKYSGEAVVISSAIHKKAMEKELLKRINPRRIIDGTLIPEILESYQYFDLPDLPHASDEVFADVGAYDGMTSVRFKKWCHGTGTSVCFEPDIGNIEKLKTNMALNQVEYQLIEKGVWDRETNLRFVSGMETTSHIVEDDNFISGNLIPVTTIDLFFQDKEVTFIKMDIEGGEQKALKGAESTIKRCKPKIAICVYHKPEDIWEIPALILDYCPDYRLWLRHYSLHYGETVLYAI